MRYDKWKKRIAKENAAREAALQAEIERLKLHQIPKKRHWFKRFITSIWGIVSALCVLSAGFIWRDEIHKLFSTKHDLFSEKNMISGDIKSPKISDKIKSDTSDVEKKVEFINNNIIKIDTSREKIDYSVQKKKYPPLRGIYINGLSKMANLSFKVGTDVSTISVAPLYKGIDILRPISLCGNDFHVGIAAINDRLFVSCSFSDLQTGDKIGEMRYNHWEIYNGKYSDFRCTDESFEVFDNKGYVAFSISYSKESGTPFVSIAGYLMSPNNVLVMARNGGSGCFPNSAEEKQKAELKIYNIKSSLKPGCN